MSEQLPKYVSEIWDLVGECKREIEDEKEMQKDYL